jgi:hypothetical protein
MRVVKLALVDEAMAAEILDHETIHAGVLPLVEAGEALGFFAEVVELGRDGLLFFQGTQWNGEQLHRHARQVGTPCAVRRG